jgi:hypothetical protein
VKNGSDKTCIISDFERIDNLLYVWANLNGQLIVAKKANNICHELMNLSESSLKLEYGVPS